MRQMRKRHAPAIRWTGELRATRALTIRQPWAWLIVNGYKDVENRGWFTRHRGPLLIHAGLSRAAMTAETRAWIAERYGVTVPRVVEYGGVVGVVDLVDCTERRTSKWHEAGEIGWILSKPRRLPFRPCKGQLNLFVPVLGR